MWYLFWVIYLEIFGPGRGSLETLHFIIGATDKIVIHVLYGFLPRKVNAKGDVERSWSFVMTLVTILPITYKNGWARMFIEGHLVKKPL